MFRAYGRYLVNFLPGSMAIGLIFPTIDCSLRESGSMAEARRSMVAGCVTGAVVGGIYKHKISGMVAGCAAFGAAGALWDIGEHFTARPSDVDKRYGVVDRVAASDGRQLGQHARARAQQDLVERN